MKSFLYLSLLARGDWSRVVIKRPLTTTIDNETFELIESKFGVFTYDRFASDLNAKTIKFNSKFYCPNSFGVNAFAYDWKHELNWLCPPINLIGKALSHIELCRAKGVLFVPFWPSAYFWQMGNISRYLLKSISC